MHMLRLIAIKAVEKKPVWTRDISYRRHNKALQIILSSLILRQNEAPTPSYATADVPKNLASPPKEPHPEVSPIFS